MLRLFTKDGREAIQSEIEYDACIRRRAQLIGLARDNAVKDITSEHPDARFLLSYEDDRFLVLLRTAGEILFGRFVDSYLPELPYVSKDEPLAVRRLASRQFLGSFSPNSFVAKSVTEEARSRRELFDDWYQSLSTRGYWTRSAAETDDVLGASLLLNGKLVAVSSILSWKENGYLSSRLTHLVDNLLRTQSSNTLVFKVADRNWGNEGTDFAVRVGIDARSLAHPLLKDRLASEIRFARAFLDDFEAELKVRINLENDREDPDAEDWRTFFTLDGPEFESEESAQERYKRLALDS